MYNYLMAYFDEGPGYLLLIVMTLSIISCFFVGLLTENYSQVDKLWSLLPPIYCLITLFYGPITLRMMIMTLIVVMWGLRLSYNFYRKGGYKWSSEDYRWPELKKTITNRIVFELFNLTFISIFQNILLLLIASPIYYTWKHYQTTPLNGWDYIATILFLLFLIGEMLADEQQWNFHLKKHQQIAKQTKSTSNTNDGFLSEGLFYYSRHPNFFCEICIWWSFYLFSHSFFNWTISGPILLTLLFQGSTKFTEAISSQKYPRYKQYQKTTAKLIPWFPKRNR
ncbi:unnamed protein product [Didymodactylos carnosus]|uniref:Steroid 5-alpha reductase C-terminal domain-containing protein n=1 Tax=Didymodactylos carnosus TaxID=1234261 RepID=A0A813P0T4_9BILA|nr:unnamed protein product [Didymodactylos carnosus]CAF1052086.1 unnamed protein product [Didymodactylos carnosus]CAF3524428.1 unnamed protein product [Didymodactylos carnosus]CAF3818681.1 unnamed protein product [Didymodactylos carnosus]